MKSSSDPLRKSPLLIFALWLASAIGVLVAPLLIAAGVVGIVVDRRIGTGVVAILIGAVLLYTVIHNVRRLLAHRASMRRLGAHDPPADLRSMLRPDQSKY